MYKRWKGRYNERFPRKEGLIANIQFYTGRFAFYIMLVDLVILLTCQNIINSLLLEKLFVLWFLLLGYWAFSHTMCRKRDPGNDRVLAFGILGSLAKKDGKMEQIATKIMLFFNTFFYIIYSILLIAYILSFFYFN